MDFYCTRLHYIASKSISNFQEEYKYAIHEPIEKEILMVDAETSMNDFQSDDDAQMEPLESLKCLNCSANHSNHSELDQHLRNVCSC